MSTQRYISTSFWDDEWIQTLDPSEKLLYLYFMTNPLTNIAGVYKITVRRVSFDTGFNQDTIGHIMEKFQKAGKAHRINEFIVLPAWPKHQKWQKSKNIKDGIDAILHELPPEVLEVLEEIGYCYKIDTPLHTPYIPPTKGSRYSDLDSDLDSDSNAPPEKPAPEKPSADAQAVFNHYFEKYRSAYNNPPVCNAGRFIKTIKTMLVSSSPDELKNAIDYIWTDDWIKSKGHGAEVIFIGATVAKFRARKKEDNGEMKLKTCPHCGEKYLLNCRNVNCPGLDL
jgi:hypothetical protein